MIEQLFEYTVPSFFSNLHTLCVYSINISLWNKVVVFMHNEPMRIMLCIVHVAMVYDQRIQYALLSDYLVLLFILFGITIHGDALCKLIL